MYSISSAIHMFGDVGKARQSNLSLAKDEDKRYRKTARGQNRGSQPVLHIFTLLPQTAELEVAMKGSILMKLGGYLF